MGLVEKKGGEGTVAVFYPNHPSMLLDKMEKDKKNLDLAKEVVSASIGALSSKYNMITGKPNVRFFEGSDAIEKITNDYPKKGTEIRQLVDISYILKKIKKETINYKDERVKKGISKRMLLSESIENINYAKSGSPLTSFKTIKKDFPTAIQVYDDTVAMLTINDEKQIGFMIDDKSVADTFKNIFDELWEKAQKVESGKTNFPSLDTE